MRMIVKEMEDGGLEFVATNNHKYLVCYKVEGEVCDPVVETAKEIFDKMEWTDCYDIKIIRIVLVEEGKLIYCRFRGKYHDLKEPLKMVIENVVTGEIYDVGYAPEH